MDRNEVKSIVIDILVDVFSGKGIDTANAENLDLIIDLGMDSILFMTLLIEIEQKFDITIPDEKINMNNFRTIENLVCTVRDIMYSTEREE